MQKRDDKQVWLKIAVADTGKGIKPEDQEKLFSEFVQVDTKKNRGIEGTGLGLAITRRLCIAMGGDISVESEYGKGSTFTTIIPQSVDSNIPFAAVDEPEKKKVLVYEGRYVFAKSLCWSLENMRVPYTMVTNLDDFAAALPREEWFFVFSGYGLYEKIKPLMESAAFPNGKTPHLALMVEFGNEPFIPDARFISLPIQSLSIANTLNGKEDSKDYYSNNTVTNGIIRYTFPGARLLVVDDIATNLKVAEGLLSPYKAAVDTCLSGLQAIELVKRAASQQREYDIVFMDHMMPEMDGIETTAAIRAWEKENGYLHKQVPIIALTANAVVGMREMFIEKGFNDYLAKPIDVSKLDETLDRWIPKEKRKSGKAERLEDEKKFIIMTDDNPANLKLGKSILSGKYRVATSPSAEKMFSLLENNHPALILLDIEMPQMNGYDAIKILKSKPETKDIPVIFLSESVDTPDREKRISLGAADYIVKPFDLQTLITSVEKYSQHEIMGTQYGK
jgi:CheY-like chemotaxis protein